MNALHAWLASALLFGAGWMLDGRSLIGGPIAMQSRLVRAAIMAGAATLLIAPLVALALAWPRGVHIAALWLGSIAALVLVPSTRVGTINVGQRAGGASVAIALSVSALQWGGGTGAPWILPLWLAWVCLMLLVSSGLLILGMVVGDWHEVGTGWLSGVVSAWGLFIVFIIPGPLVSFAEFIRPGSGGAMLFIWPCASFAILFYIWSWCLASLSAYPVPRDWLHRGVTLAAAALLGVALLRLTLPQVLNWDRLVWLLVGSGLAMVIAQGGSVLWQKVR